MKWKPSIYNYYFVVENRKTGIFNSLSKALLVLDEDEYYELLHDNTVMSADVKEGLIKNNILVPITINEHELVNIVRTKGILEASKSIYRIFTTTDCNARCFYCYEKNIAHLYMTRTTAAEVAQFIIEHVGDRPCLIQWFGGEPLMNIEVIDIITKKLKQALGGNKIDFMMITNGSLLSEELVEKMTENWNIRRVQISLDGAYGEYECRKSYVSIANAFTVVLHNIVLLLEKKVFVSLRINYDADNYKNAIELIGILEKKLGRFQNLHVYAYHIFKTNQSEEADPLFKEEWFAMQEALIKAGFVKPLEAYSLAVRKTQCFACSSKSFVITPDGKLYKCALATNNKSECVGSIQVGITEYSVIEGWCDTSLRQECAECEFYRCVRADAGRACWDIILSNALLKRILRQMY